jgi:hypothetical protein
MFAITMAGGTSMSFPDACMTQVGPAPAPLPYPNTGQMTMGFPTTMKILIGGMPALHKSSIIPLTNGDEAGNVPGGVMSGTFIQKMEFMLCSMTVMFEGQGAVRSTMDSVNGNGNTPMMGMVMAPSQTTVMAGG